MKIVDDLARRIIASPARTWGDVLAFAAVAFWAQWPGVAPEGPRAKENIDCGFRGAEGIGEQSTIKLIEAVFTVAGVGPAKESTR